MGGGTEEDKVEGSGKNEVPAVSAEERARMIAMSDDAEGDDNYGADLGEDSLLSRDE